MSDERPDGASEVPAEALEAALVDTDNLPPTQYLVLEVLAGRHRLGEQLWTFLSRPAIRAAADQLASLGLIGWKGGVESKTIRAWLTDAGRAAALMEGYESPDFKRGVAAGCAQAAADIAAKLRRGAAGRREYAASTPPTAEILNQEAVVLDSAAIVAAGDLKPMFGWMPSWRWTPEMNEWLAATARLAEEGNPDD